MEYVMGLAGTEGITHVNIATLQGVVVQSFTVGAINFLFATEEEIAHNLAEVFVTAQMAGYPIRSCRQVCVGTAGLKNGIAYTKLAPVFRTVMRRCGYTGDALLLGEEAVCLAGALGKSKGAILMAGNSSICFGQNTMGRQHKTGGMGELTDDDGSAYAIGREILRAVARASDGRGQPTRLTSYVYSSYNLTNTLELSNFLYDAPLTYKDICELATVLPKACQVMDKVALAIAEKAVDQLEILVEPVIEKLALQNGTLAVAGRILLNDVFVGISFKKRMSKRYPDLQCVPPRNDGVVGAVLLAKERLALRGYAH